MINTPSYFALEELVCPHVFEKYKIRAWMFLDQRLLTTIDTIRDRLGHSIYVNDWVMGGTYDERGLRCLRCDLVKAKIQVGEIYMSAHCFGKALDFSVSGLNAEEVRLWIVARAGWWPYPIRLEKDVDWIHLDVWDSNTDQKVYIFSA